MKKEIEYEIIMWDWKEDRPSKEIQEAINKLKFSPRVFEIDTYSDQECVLVTDAKISSKTAQRLFEESLMD